MKFACFTAALLTFVLEQHRVKAVGLHKVPEPQFSDFGQWDQYAQVDSHSHTHNEAQAVTKVNSGTVSDLFSNSLLG